MIHRSLRFVALGLLCLALGACGSRQPEISPLEILRSIPQLLGQNKPAPVRISQAQIAQVLSATPEPLILVESEATQNQSLLVQIERNRSYATFATETRQSIVLRDGLVTSTRGIGGDLMSSDVDALLRAVQGGSASEVPYTLRFLTPEDVTRSYRTTCRITRSGGMATANCEGDGVSFTNTFVLGPYGQITSSRQWIGPFLGYFRVSVLRG